MRKFFNILISISLLLVAVYYFGPDKILDHAKEIKIEYFFGVLLLNLILVPLATRRWQLVLNLLSPLPKFPECLRAQLVSMYAGLFFPGLISGTAVKVVLMRQIGVRVKHTLLSVVFDKIAVVLPLLICIAISIPFMADTYLMEKELGNFPKLVFAVFLALACGIGSILLFLRYLRKDSNIFKELLITHKAKFLAILLWGLAIIIVGIFQYWLLFEFEASLVDLFLVAPAVIFLSSLPLSIGGWGIREGSGILFFSLIGIPGEVALVASIQVGLAGVLISMIGAFMWSKDLIPESKQVMDAAMKRNKGSEEDTKQADAQS